MFVLPLTGLCACASQATSAGLASPRVSGYRLLRDVSMPGSTSRWDYQAYDPSSHRLYLAELGASQVVVFDTVHQKVVGIVKGVSKVHGIALAPDLHRVFATATGSNAVAIIDTRTLTLVKTVPAGSYPNGVAYDPATEQVYVSDGNGNADTILDARTGRSLGAVGLGAGVCNTQYQAATSTIYVTLGQDNQLVAIDPRRAVVTRRYSLPGCQWAHGLELDTAARHRAFVACNFNSRLLSVDLVSGRVTQDLSTGGGPDVLAIDPRLGRLYVAAEDGVLAVFDVSGPRIRKIAQGPAGPFAHTVSVDPRSHVVYLPLAPIKERPVLRELVPG